MRAHAAVAVSAILTGLAGGPAQAQIDTGVGLDVGVLTCSSVPGTRTNLIITSTQEVECTFQSIAGTETYRGETGIDFGIDLEFGANTQLIWNVVIVGEAELVDLGASPLSGTYRGASTAVALGLGIGVNYLIRTENFDIGNGVDLVLQPYSVEGIVGAGASLGLGYLSLEPTG